MSCKTYSKYDDNKSVVCMVTGVVHNMESSRTSKKLEKVAWVTSSDRVKETNEKINFSREGRLTEVLKTIMSKIVVCSKSIYKCKWSQPWGFQKRDKFLNMNVPYYNFIPF